MNQLHDEDARREYWISYMEEMNGLVERCLAHPVEENGEPMRPIPDAFAAAGVETMFSDSLIDNRLERIYFIRENLMDQLVAIARDMNERGWIMKIEDGYRTCEMQTALVKSSTTFDRIVRTCVWEHGGPPPVELVFRRARVMIANYGKIGTHTQGAAVDVSVFRREDHTEVSRGKFYLEMSEYTPMRSPFITDEERNNRLAITEIMERYDFVHFPGEFWHYNSGDVMYQILTGSGKPGIYGAVHLDVATGNVTPYEDPLAPLIPLEKMETELSAALQRIGS